MRGKKKVLDLPLPDRGELLRSIPMFSQLGDEEIHSLSRIGRWATLAKDTILFNEAEKGLAMYVVGRGKVGIFKSNPNSSTFIAERRKGDIIGEMAVFDGRPRSASAITQSDCILLEIRREEFMACVKKNPSVAMGVVANLIDRLREADERATVATSLDVMGRLAHFLLSEARFIQDRQVIKPRKSDSVIGVRLGCSRETVNRKLSELESDGAIVKERDFIEILDEDHLRDLVGE